MYGAENPPGAPGNGTSSPGTRSADSSVGDGDEVVAPINLYFSICLNFGVLASSVLIWWVLRSVRGGDGAPVTQPTSVRNYLSFLRNCRDAFIVLTLASAATTIPRWGPAPLALGLQRGQLSTTGGMDATGLVVMLLDTAIRGVLALLFIERLQGQIEDPDLAAKDLDAIRQTLWLSDLPVYDSSTRQVFVFDNADFARVAGDLETAIRDELKHHELDGADMRVEVAPVVDRWYEVSLNLRNARERRAALELVVSSSWQSGGLFRGLLLSCRTRQFRQLSAEVTRLEAELEEIQNGRKKISGSAFISFVPSGSELAARSRDHFLRNKPRIWHCRSHAWFTFGRPPFASVTLSCGRAPHPSDVDWLNLHVQRWEQLLRLTVMSILLLVTMIVLVAPVTLASQLKAVEIFLQRARRVSHQLLHGSLGGYLNEHFCDRWVTLSEQVPTFILMLINSLVVPDLIGLTSIYALLQWAREDLRAPMSVLLPTVAKGMMHSPGIFALRYILNCTCLTNANAILQIPRAVYQFCARRVANTAREHVQVEEVWEFAWGYWYAWTLSIFALGVCMSSAVPSVLPCAALFFAVQYKVDGYNLMHLVYAHGAETENAFVIRALHYMRLIVASWWTLMGLSLAFSAKQMSVSGSWNAQLSSRTFGYLAASLVAVAFVVALWSQCWIQAWLHDSQTQVVNVSSKGLAGTRLYKWLCGGASTSRSKSGTLLSTSRDSDLEDAERLLRTEPAVGRTELSWDARSVIHETDTSPL
eukprot:TRINITY_DN23033_c0_g1_i6.p1 TRINITY_DN23033_c0_g1~~TRINITY_DN23033_c0_g1_i6.p1  ORF type:complete len:779 (-),score=121.58 TRINITY_DN23033_c0_g1_i6:117-2390(-)